MHTPDCGYCKRMKLGRRCKRHETKTSFKKVVYYTKEFVTTVVKNGKPDIDEHCCGFNDGDCVCSCYKAGQDEYEANLLKLLGDK